MTAFDVVVLGCSGGPKESNLSGYLISGAGAQQYISLDAGSLLAGLEIAHKQNHFGNISLLDVFQKHHKGYLISHSHLDHVLGLVIGSQSDVIKPIMGRQVTLDAIRDHLFNGKIWPNYGNEGKNPIAIYHYQRLKMHEKVPIDGTEMSVEAFPLYHAVDCPSTVFLLEWKGNFALYFGDTACDASHEHKTLDAVWKKIAPLVREKKLKGMFLECSYPKGLSGPGVDAHLDTVTMINELKILEGHVGAPLQHLKVIVTHRKENLEGPDVKQRIAEELSQHNTLGVQFIFPRQGEKIVF